MAIIKLQAYIVLIFSGPKEKKARLSKFSLKKSQARLLWPRLSRMYNTDLITVASGVEYLEFSDCVVLGHTSIFRTKVCITHGNRTRMSLSKVLPKEEMLSKRK